MNRIKIVFIIPGFRHKISQKGYIDLKQKLKKDGYIVVPVAIPWRDSTITDNAEHFLKIFEKSLAKFKSFEKEVYLLGFSYGAMIAFLAATKISVTGLILCSLSPFFKEDLPKKLPKNISVLQEKRYSAFAKLPVAKLAKKIKAKDVMMLYGEKESVRLIARTKSAFRAIASRKKYLFEIQNTDHNIADTKYISAISFATTFL